MRSPWLRFFLFNILWETSSGDSVIKGMLSTVTVPHILFISWIFWKSYHGKVCELLGDNSTPKMREKKARILQMGDIFHLDLRNYIHEQDHDIAFLSIY